MVLFDHDAALFFKLMWAVQNYVNQKQAILPGVNSVEDYTRLPHEQKHKLRNELYKRRDWFSEFVAENPAGLPPDELEIVARWKGYIAGKFYVLRSLKRHAIFMSEHPQQFYAVLGINDRLDDVLPFMPVLVEGVLLPFRGRIIYDGLLMSYSVHFGPGIRSNFNEEYQRAKESGQIIETLEADTAVVKARRPQKPARDWRPELDNIVALTEKLGKADSKVQSQAFAVLKASAQLAQASAQGLDNFSYIYGHGKKVSSALRRLEKVLERAMWND